MTLGAGTRQEAVVAHWDFPIRGVIKGIRDLAIPIDALYDASNVEINDGYLTGRRGLTALDAQTFGATPMDAINFWENGVADWLCVVTTEKLYTKNLSTGTWTDRAGGLTASQDDATRITQFGFGTPTVNKIYFCNGKDPLKSWGSADATAQTVVATSDELVSNGNFGADGTWTYGTNWSWDNANFEADHLAGSTEALEQNVGVSATTKYRVVFTVKNRTAGSVTPQLGGTAGTAVSSNTTSTQDITTADTTNLKFVPSSDFDGSIDDVSVKPVGDAPVFKDITVLADRLIGLVGTHEVRWGDPLSDTSFPALNSKLLAETPTPTIAIRALGQVSAAVYKKDAIWGVDVTGLAGGSSFRFNQVEHCEGPGGPNALVDAYGMHIYMTKNGRVGMYNGFMRKWIADGIWSSVRAEIDSTKPSRIHGVYLKELFQVRFFYKRVGVSDTDGLVIIQLERKDLQVPYSAFIGRMGKSITASCAMEDDSFTTSLVFSNNAAAEKSYHIKGSDDDGVAISSFIQHGLVTAAKLEVARVLPLEIFAERNAAYGSVTAKICSSNVLDTIGGSLSAGSTIDLTTVPIKNPIGFDVRGRFLSLRLEWTSASTLRYRGAVLRGSEAL